MLEEQNKNELYREYLRSKRYELESNIKPNESYEESYKRLANYFETYKYIFCKLSETLQIELKYDVIDHLNQLIGIQSTTKHQVLIKKFIVLIENFKGFEDFYVDNEEELLNFQAYPIIGKEIFNRFPEFHQALKIPSFMSVLDRMIVCNYTLKIFFIADGLGKHTLNETDYIDKLESSEIYRGAKDFKIFSSTDSKSLIDNDIVEIYYRKGYEEGKTLWENEYHLPVNTGVSEIYLQRVKSLYCEKNLSDINKHFYPYPYPKGCNSVKNISFQKISLKGVEWLGFNSALTFKIDSFLKEIDVEWNDVENLGQDHNQKNYQTNRLNQSLNSTKKGRIYKEIEGFIFFQIYFETTNGVLRNNDSIISLENWKEVKDTFINQRMKQYDKKYSIDEKIDGGFKS